MIYNNNCGPRRPIHRLVATPAIVFWDVASGASRGPWAEVPRGGT